MDYVDNPRRREEGNRMASTVKDHFNLNCNPVWRDYLEKPASIPSTQPDLGVRTGSGGKRGARGEYLKNITISHLGDPITSGTHWPPWRKIDGGVGSINQNHCDN